MGETPKDRWLRRIAATKPKIACPWHEASELEHEFHGRRKVYISTHKGRTAIGVWKNATLEEVAAEMELGIPRRENGEPDPDWSEGRTYEINGTDPRTKCQVQVHINGKLLGEQQIMRYTPIEDVLRSTGIELSWLQKLTINCHNYEHWRIGGWPEEAVLALNVDTKTYITVRLRTWGCLIREDWAEEEGRRSQVWRRFRIEIGKNHNRDSLAKFWKTKWITYDGDLEENSLIDALDPEIERKTIEEEIWVDKEVSIRVKIGEKIERITIPRDADDDDIAEMLGMDELGEYEREMESWEHEGIWIAGETITLQQDHEDTTEYEEEIISIIEGEKQGTKWKLIGSQQYWK
jgi:hypothetical protein